MVLFLFVFVIVGLFSLSYTAWKYYNEPSRVLVRQGKAMGWTVTNHSQEGGTYFLKDHYRSCVSWKDKHITLIEPLHDEPFKDFIAIEKWLEGKSDIEKQDAVWGELTEALTAELQGVFMVVYASENIEQYVSTESIPVEVIIKLSEAANKAANVVEVSPGLILLVIHQYIDSDCELRKEHRSNWVEFMTSRPAIAPQPETYIDYMNTTYFHKQMG